jgi:hypothetical protein
MERLSRTVVVIVLVVASAFIIARPHSHSTAAARPSPTPGATVSTDPSSTPGSVPAVVRPGRLLRPALSRYLGAQPGTITAAVVDTATGQSFVYRPGVRSITASIMKVDILETLLSRAQAEDRDLTEDERELSRRMIEESDNDAAEDLWELLGGAPAVAQYNARAGLENTVPNQAGYWGLSTTSALDQVRLIKQICYPSNLFTRSSRRYALDLMTHVDPAQAWGVSAGVARKATVALKNGWLPHDGAWQVNSIGCVRGDGRNYVIAVLVGGTSSESGNIRTIEGLSKRVWKQLGPSTSHPHGPR